MTRTELRVDVWELADLKVVDLRLVVLMVAVLDVAEIGGADLNLGKVEVADLRLAEIKGSETPVTAAQTVLLNTTWLSLSRWNEAFQCRHYSAIYEICFRIHCLGETQVLQ
jgi:hypothetical protein